MFRVACSREAGAADQDKTREREGDSTPPPTPASPPDGHPTTHHTHCFSLTDATYLDSDERHSDLKGLDDHSAEEDEHGPPHGVDEGEDAEVGSN